MNEVTDLVETIGEVIPLDWSTIIQIGVVIFVTAVLDLVVRSAFLRLERKANESDRVWDDAFASMARRPARIAIWVVGISFAVGLIGEDIRAGILDPVPDIRNVILIGIVAWTLIRIVRRIEAKLVSRWYAEGESVDQTTVDAVSKLLRITILVSAGLIALQTLGVSLTGLLAFGGIGGLAIGFAAQDLLSNFFGGLTIYLERPFSVGDWVRSPDREIEGTVEEIGWRRTVIRTFDLRPLYVPNAVFNQISLENPSRMFHRRIFETIGVRYDDFSRIEGILKDIRQMLDEHDEITKERTLMVNFNTYGDSSLDFFIYCFTETRVWTEFHAVKEDVLIRVGQIIEKHGAEIAFPTRTLHVPEQIVMDPAGEDSPQSRQEGARQ
ncbi:mechanosensitive ion channel family protein [Natronospira bacteriovora]|uniref:Mechanosensitive ion channel family protein n=1 Tax=Natronospira bacteriovora TaxID=3069753 RepID=A0ABU0W2Y2_9GAMM|nr:mechanosensitive ion channel family protein [Natronospira sp. AB-CW4]MDQ2068273.1 mechanosensitive ion channel family protein [Natronospira sp. AB-CW4]